MKKIIATLLTSLCLGAGLTSTALASEGGIEWDRFPTSKMNDLAALQHGAKIFVNYCLNCHSAAYMRYNRLKDIGLTDEQIKGNLLFAGRLVCADPAAFASVRGMPQCLAMGQAAGTAAAMALADGLSVQALDPQRVVAALAAQGMRGIGGDVLLRYEPALAA